MDWSCAEARPRRRWLASLTTAAVVLTSTLSLNAGELWRHDFSAAQAEAATQRKPLLIGITATWCGACRQMQQLTLTDSRVTRQLDSQCIGVLVDIDEHPELIAQYKLEAFPTTMLLSASGELQKRWVGYQPVSEFAAELDRLTRGNRPAGAAVDPFPAVSAMFPSNAPTCAFSGYCLVSLLEDNKLRRGLPEITTEYNGHTVCFVSEEHRTRFLRAPYRYWPVANGTCVVTSLEERAQKTGDPRVGVRWRGRLWFFTDRERQQRFLRSPYRFAPDRM